MKVANPVQSPLPPYTNLAVAIIERACQDYATARYARLRFPHEKGSDRPSRTEVECMEFFKNRDHPAWIASKMEPEYLITSLNKLVAQCLKEGHPPKLSQPRSKRKDTEDVSDEENG